MQGCWDSLQDDGEEQHKTRMPIVNESEIIQIGHFNEAHSDVIKSIQYVACTDRPLVFSAGADKFVKIHSLDGEEMGTLRQGYMLKNDYEWKFVLKAHDDNFSTR